MRTIEYTARYGGEYEIEDRLGRFSVRRNKIYVGEAPTMEEARALAEQHDASRAVDEEAIIGALEHEPTEEEMLSFYDPKPLSEEDIEREKREKIEALTAAGVDFVVDERGNAKFKRNDGSYR